MTRCTLSIAIAVLVTLLAVVAPRPADAWWCLGHMTTMQIALDNVDAHVRRVTNATFLYLRQIGPFPLLASGAVSGACWADDVKTYGLHPTDEWHYRDEPFVQPSNYTVDPTVCPIQNENAVTAAGSFYSAARRRGQNPWTTSFALAFYAHIMGDLHQPLHSAALFGPAYPRGDAGGNLLKVYWNGTLTNLHSFWDSLCASRDLADPGRPLTQADTEYIRAVAARFNATHGASITQQDVAVTSPARIADESYALAVEVVYSNGTLVNGSTLDEAYRARCQATVERQIVLGGLRLARQLTAMFADAPVPELLVLATNASGNGAPTAAGAFDNLGPREAGLFCGGFAVALAVMGVAWLVFARLARSDRYAAVPQSDSEALYDAAARN
jgi:hypothetical protein